MATLITRKLLTQLLADVNTLRQQEELPLIERLRRDPAEILLAAGKSPDAWQADILRSWDQRVLMLCSRQSGKSQTAAALALRTALFQAPALVLVLSPTLRQSGELFRDKVLPLWRALGYPYRARPASQLALELSNGSRIISLPGEEGTILGYSSVALLVIDEAARVPESLYLAVRPMLAVSRGRLVCLTSAWAKGGWFWKAYEEGKGRWKRVKITAAECPRITAEFLEEERATMPAQRFAMDYLCQWGEAEDAVFSIDDLRAATAERIPPLFGA